MSKRAELTLEIIGALEVEVKQGHWPNVVARRIGIHGNTMNAWMKRGETAYLEDTGQTPTEPEFLYRYLYESIEEAEAVAEMEMLAAAMEQAKMGRAGAGTTILTTMERRFSDRWRKRDALAGDVSESWEANVKRFIQQQGTTQLRAVD